MLCINEGIKKTGRFRQNNFNVSFRLLDAEGDGVSSPVVVNGKQYVGAKVKRQPLIFHGLRAILRKSGAVFYPAFSSTLWYSVVVAGDVDFRHIEAFHPRRIFGYCL